jgi:5,10-methylene-tetrahydrofolate dehydrogenase/methenyl tetrahydrofolate cyclohydrolase
MLQLPRHIDEAVVLAAISVDKDVDGFHPLNIGKLTMKVNRLALGLPGCLVHAGCRLMV